MIYRLPALKCDLSKELLDKVKLLKNQKSAMISNGKLLRNREEEWDVKFNEYASTRAKLDGIEAQFASKAVPADRYVETVAECRKLEELASFQERDMLEMLSEPINRSQLEKAESKAIRLSRQRTEIRPVKGQYSMPRSREQRVC